MFGLTGSSSQPNKLNVPALVLNNATPNWVKVFGNEEIMLQRMMVDMPLPMPCSVTSSPSHIKIIDPAVIDVTANAQLWKLTSTEPPVLAASSSWKRI